MEPANKKLLIEGAESFGIHLDKKAVGDFDLYLKELLKWNEKINLTAIQSEKDIILKHFLDSLSIFPFLSNASCLLDIGSGAGFPGIPLKIVKPLLEITLIDSVRKKVDFQRHVLRMLDLTGIVAIHKRVQDKEILQKMKDRFDIVTSRAFSDLHTFLILSYPLLKKGGMGLAMRGPSNTEEIRSSYEKEGIQYYLKKNVVFSLPFSDIKRSILLFEKG